jgi:hypothetical protein
MGMWKILKRLSLAIRIIPRWLPKIHVQYKYSQESICEHPAEREER